MVLTPNSGVRRNLSKIILLIPYIYFKWDHSLKEIKEVSEKVG